MITIAVANHKGGVAKTTTVANLGACLAQKGRSVMMVDLDHQCNLTDNFGFEAMRLSPESTSYGLVMNQAKLEGTMRPAGPNLTLVPGHISLAELDIELSKNTALNRESR